ncbi:MAG: hypothetical protein HY013_14365 [Candidatus Solibacter usitatus]|nr:hypothetical protein [Candidatus Solibacter usitatus]
MRSFRLVLAWAWTLGSFAQTVSLRPAAPADLPPVIDGNSAAFWSNGQLNLFHSTGVPAISRGPNQFSLWSTDTVQFDSAEHRPVWFEAAWQDEDGLLFLWYHHEPGGLCRGNSLTAPKVGAAISRDGGSTVQDLGIILESGDAIDCGAKNGFFAGGHGDASVILDREKKYFYFFFTNYGGSGDEQGVSVARMAFEDRFRPAGAVRKYYSGDWLEPGIGGHVSPIFPAARAWQHEDADSFWGPSIHWNTQLEQYVVLLNRACCRPGWPQEGIYVSWNADLSQPGAWRPVQRLLAKSEIGWSPGYYPQVLGLEDGETDSLTGAVARLYIHGRSAWEIVFDKNPPPDPVGDCWEKPRTCPPPGTFPTTPEPCCPI